MASPPSDDRVELVEALVGELGAWLLDRCAKAAAGRTGFDKSDVYQETMIRLLTSSIEVQLDNRGIKTFLSKRVEWATRDLVDRNARQAGVPVPAEEIEDRLARTAATPADESFDAEDPAGSATAILGRSPLSAVKAAAVGNDCGEPGKSATEFAQLIGRTYDQVRKDKERGLRELRTWLGLTEAEEKVYLAVRRGDVPGAAEQLRLSQADVWRLLAAANRRIDRKFTGEEADPDVR